MKYIKYSLISLLSIIISTFFISLLSFIGLYDFVSFLQILTISVIFFLGSYNCALKKKKKGYINGIYFSLITISFMILINIILIRNFSFNQLLYYVILITCSMIGGMFSNIKGPRN